MKKDQHTIPYLGTMSIDEVMCALKKIGYNGYFNFESNSAIVKGVTTWPYPKRQYDGGDKLLNAPVFVCDDLEKMMYKIGKHILQSYDCYEE